MWRIILILVALVTVVAVFGTRFTRGLYRTPAAAVGTARFAGVSLRLDYATNEAARERGLGGRTSVPERYGMLFAFPTSDYWGFWMKDMQVPIDIFWLDESGRVVSFVPDADPASYPSVFYPAAPARYVLETAAGFAAAHAAATGTPLVLQKSPTVSQ